MEALPSDPRQPPDGHEFPDYEEAQSEPATAFARPNYQQNYQQITAENKRTPLKTYKSIECINLSQNNSSFNDFSSDKPILSKINSVSNSDLSLINNSKKQFDINDDITLSTTGLEPILHTRSQSLIDMSALSKQKSDRWNLLAEQRRKGLSKLKGLVIPEHVAENEPVPAVNIPEIVSQPAPFVVESKVEDVRTKGGDRLLQEVPLVALCLTMPPWAANNSTIPKYSPAFKRKSLQLYPACRKGGDKSDRSRAESEECSLSDAPKSLESITSPTRSDCSFDYMTNTMVKGRGSGPGRTKDAAKTAKDLVRSEDESDNDSAVSSSQSSYISRCSPPPSPTRSLLDYDTGRTKFDPDTERYSNMHSRLLKPASVEAINRKNILASAKCRSGRDLKVGSPVIQRKYEEDVKNVAEINVTTEDSNKIEKKPVNTNMSNCTGTKRIDKIHTAVHSDSNKSKIARIQSKSDGKSDGKSETIRTSSLGVLSRKAKGLSVTDLRKNFESFGVAAATSFLPKPIGVTIEPRKRDPKKLETTPAASKGAKLDPKLDAKKVKAPPARRAASAEPPPPTGPVKTVILCPEFFGGSIGITLAGGTDYETKEITVHKIRYGSVAYKDGKLKRGDKILSINGKNTTNMTHTQSVDLLKEPVAKFVLIVEEGKDDPALSPHRKTIVNYDQSEPKSPPRTPPVRNVTHVVNLAKDGAGLGFSIEGGKDSPQGDLPVKIKKIFQGGAADKSGELSVGDELLVIGDVNLMNLSRIEVWSLMKKLPDGNVPIHIHR